MPQVTINEIDQSRYLSVATRSPLVALTPVISSFGPTDKAVVIENESQYNAIYGYQLPVPVKQDMTRNYAITLINSGVTLLTKRIEPIVLIEDSTTHVVSIDTTYHVSSITAGATYACPVEITDETFTVGTTTKLTHGEVIPKSFTATVTGTIDSEPVTYTITESTGTSAVSALTCKSGETVLEGFTGKLTYETGNITLSFPASITVTSVKMDYAYNGLATVATKAKYFGSKGNDVAVQFSKITLNSGALDVNTNNVIYKINTYIVNGHNNVTESANGLYIGTLDTDLVDYYGVDSVTVSTNPVDDNFFGNTNYLNSQLDNIDITISTDIVLTNNDYKNILETLCALCGTASGGTTIYNKAFLLTGGADYFNKVIMNEEFVIGTDVNVKNTPVISGTFTAENSSYLITETDTVSEDGYTVTLACVSKADGTALVGFSGTLNYNTGELNITGVTGTITVNYQASMLAANITKQFTDAISYNYSAVTYPATYNKFWEEFADHYVYDFDVIVSSGFTGFEGTAEEEYDGVSRSNIHLNILRLAKNRGDAVALLDTPQNWDYESVYKYTEKTGGYQSYYSYGAVHAPWCKMRDLSTGNYAMMPASLAFLGAIANGLVTNGATSIWYAPAGVARASCPNVISAQYEIGGTILNYWQNNNIARVNPIMKILAYGYCVYGNATLMQNMKGYTKSSLQSLGTRFLCNTIKKAIFSLCVRLTFEPNDYNLWSTFRTELGDVLRQYQLNGVLSEYEIVMDESTVTDEDKQNLTVPGKVNIVPTLPAEYFDIDFTISAQGVTFAEQVLGEEE